MTNSKGPVGQVVYESEEDEQARLKPPEPKKAPTPFELVVDDDPKPQEGDVPLWAAPHIPPGLKVPRGRLVSFIRFRSAWTDAPEKGVMTTFKKRQADGSVKDEEVLSRVLMCWTLSDGEERLAMQRTRGEPGRSYEELAKQQVRAVDGLRVDWSGEWAKNEGLYPAARLWTELGGKCRPMVINLYRRTHSLSDEELADFLLNCVVARSAVAG